LKALRIDFVRAAKFWGEFPVKLRYFNIYGISNMKFEMIFLILSSTLILIFAIQANAQEKFDSLYRIRVDNKYGFIDKTGKVIVQPVFAEAGEFSEGLAVVKSGDRFGFIDATGKFVIKPTFYRAESFSDGLAIAFAPGSKTTTNLSDGVWGYIDKTGKMVIEIKPDYSLSPFSEGLAVFFKNGKAGYIDKTGKIVISLQFETAFAFSEGLAKVRVGKEYGFIDKTGKMIIKPQFPQPSTPDILGRPHPTDHDLPFRDGLASIQIGSLRKWAYINKTGKVVFEVPDKRFSPFSFSEGRVRIIGENHDEGFLDTNGNIVIKPIWRAVGDFSEGLAAVERRNNYQEGCENNNCWGYIDKTGRIVIEPQFSRAEPFRDGLAYVWMTISKINSSDHYKTGYIDKAGKFVWSTIVK
jgi:hypothetical protein